MNIKLNTLPGNIVPSTVQMHTEKAQETKPPAHAPRYLSDQVFISPEGREVAEDLVKNFDIEKFDHSLDGQEDKSRTQFEALPKMKLINNYRAAVDPDHTIWTKAYCDALAEQFKQAEQTIKDHYAEEHEKNSSMSFDDAWNYITHKYLDTYSSFPEFRSDMSRDERMMAYQQERSLLVTGRIHTLADPYALASTGGTLNFFDSDKTAREAANVKIEALIQEYKQSHGITDE